MGDPHEEHHDTGWETVSEEPGKTVRRRVVTRRVTSSRVLDAGDAPRILNDPAAGRTRAPLDPDTPEGGARLEELLDRARAETEFTGNERHPEDVITALTVDKLDRLHAKRDFLRSYKGNVAAALALGLAIIPLALLWLPLAGIAYLACGTCLYLATLHTTFAVGTARYHTRFKLYLFASATGFVIFFGNIIAALWLSRTVPWVGDRLGGQFAGAIAWLQSLTP